jgi:transcriptional regulator with XRE-family HTH domain
VRHFIIFTMPTRERPVDRGRRQGELALARTGRAIHEARIAAGLSQRECGRVAGMDHSKVGRIERGRDLAVAVPDLAALTAILGLDLRLDTYPAATAHRDRGHAKLVDRFRACLHPSWEFRTEVPLPNPGDLRSWDGLIRGAGVRIGIEAETAPRDGQELQRRLAAKRRDGGVDHVVLVFADTRGNRAFLRDYRAQLETSLPLPSRTLLRALRDGQDPRDSGILVL